MEERKSYPTPTTSTAEPGVVVAKAVSGAGVLRIA
ncbi:unnamed protein product [Strongylus vulgaris]|uniref:Uncharacterized protein n=1 Tax=Strongylus vulgaris TaxID=40348 RepID=A0A3P7J9P1_STRVU|nr:unnamed protein product [Strongylus vulgaris]